MPFQVLIPEIGKFINQLPDAPINEILKHISHNVFQDDSKLDDIKLSYSSYLIRAKPSNVIDFLKLEMIVPYSDPIELVIEFQFFFARSI